MHLRKFISQKAREFEIACNHHRDWFLRTIFGPLESLKYSRVKPQESQTFWIVSCERNIGRPALRCLDSVYRQRYPADCITHLYIDDASTDGTAELITAWLQEHPGHQVRFLRRDRRRGGTANTLDGFRLAPPGSIVLELNGDDWLPDPEVLDFLNRVYADPDIWMTYNTFRFSNGKLPEFFRPIPRKSTKNSSYRQDRRWLCQHLHSFRAELFSHIKDRTLIDPATGAFWASADDQAIYYSMLELAGRHARHLYRQTYVYNFHDRTDAAIDHPGSLERAARIRKMPGYAPLRHLKAMPPHIYYITDTSGMGGAEKYLLTLAREAQRKTRVSVALPFRPENRLVRERLQEAGLELLDLPYFKGNYGRNIIIAYKFFRPRRSDAFFHFSLTFPDACRWPLLVASLLGVPFIITEHAVPPDPCQAGLYFRVTHFLFKPLKKFSYRRARQVIAVSRASRDLLVEKFGLPREKITVIHNGIDLGRRTGFHAERQEDGEFQALRGKTILLTAGRLSEEKGHTNLLSALGRAIKENPSLFLIIAGDGPLREALAGRIRDLGLADHVRLAGFRSDLPQLLRLCDIFILPSLFESLPLALLEAMAAGKPVIASRVGGIPEVVEDGKSGILVKACDAKELAGALTRLAADRELRQRLAGEAAEVVEAGFSLSAMLAETLSHYPGLS